MSTHSRLQTFKSQAFYFFGDLVSGINLDITARLYQYLMRRSVELDPQGLVWDKVNKKEAS